MQHAMIHATGAHRGVDHSALNQQWHSCGSWPTQGRVRSFHSDLWFRSHALLRLHGAENPTTTKIPHRASSTTESKKQIKIPIELKTVQVQKIS